MPRTLNEILLDAINLKLHMSMEKAKEEKKEEEHVCEFVETDCDICSDCGEHTSFCEECGSECCGARAYMPD